MRYDENGSQPIWANAFCRQPIPHGRTHHGRGERILVAYQTEIGREPKHISVTERGLVEDL